MTISKLKLFNFRSYDEREFEFSPEVNVLVGPNGVGKTNLLEAVYTLLHGKSFRDSDEQLLMYNQVWWKVVGQVDGYQRELRYQLGQTSPKQLLVDDVAKGRFTYKQQLPVVLFEPDDLLMLHGSPHARRSYLDNLLLKIEPSYRQTLAKYERALLQRNNLLKKGLPSAQLRDSVFVWDIALSEYGATMIRRRSELVEQINQELSQYYSSIAGKVSSLSMVYYSSVKGEAHVVAQRLAQQLEKDRLRGFTSVGPHRDDADFILNGKNVKQTASRGEVRTIVLALKQNEVQLVATRTGRSPILLLDDVFSELDEKRQKKCLLDKKTQTIVTTTKKPNTSKINVIQI